MPNRLSSQLAFIHEVDKLKSIFRQTLLLDGSRKENDAEHSWHLALMAILLVEHANFPNLNLLKIIKMVLIHDIVEIDAGDTFCYDDVAYTDKNDRESLAATRLFGLLPTDQKDDFLALWHEFEARETPEARFAAALDRLQPLLHNCLTNGQTWQEHNVRADQVFSRNQHIAEGSKTLWDYAAAEIKNAIQRGFLSS